MKKIIAIGMVAFASSLISTGQDAEAASIYSDSWSDEQGSKSNDPANLSTTLSGDTTTHYQNRYGGYEFDFPSEWMLDTGKPSKYARIFTDSFRLDITVDDIEALYKTQDEFLKESLGFLEETKVGETYFTTNQGYRVYEKDYLRKPLAKLGTSDMNAYTYYAVEHEGKHYLFQLKTSEANWPSVKKEVAAALNTLLFTNTNMENGTASFEPSVTSPRIAYTEEEHELIIPENKFAMGIYQTGNANGIYQKENDLETHFGTQMFYKPVNSNYDSYVGEMIENNRVPLVTLHFDDSTLTDDSQVVYGILEGKYDSYIQSWANGIRDAKAPVFFRIANEMNGDWVSWSHKNLYNDPDLYKAAYRHVVDIFRAQQATNAKFVWNPNDGAKPRYAWNDAALYYPGDAYVDWIGMTAYNFGQNEWRDFKYFDDLYQDLYAEYMRLYPNKPMMISEFASLEKTGNKPYFIADMFDKIGSNYPNLKLVIWFHHTDGEFALPYDSSAASLFSFKEGMTTASIIDYPIRKAVPTGLLSPNSTTQTPNSKWTFTGVAQNPDIKEVHVNGTKQTFRWASWRQFDQSVALKTGENPIAISVLYQDGTTEEFDFFVEKTPSFRFSTSVSPKVTTAPSVKSEAITLTGLVKDRIVSRMTINGKEVAIKWSWKQFDHRVSLQAGINEFNVKGYDSNGNLVSEETYYLFRDTREFVVTSPTSLSTFHPHDNRTITGMAKSSRVKQVLVDGKEQTLKWSWRQFDQNLPLKYGSNHFRVDAYYEGELNGQPYYYPIHSSYEIDTPNFSFSNGASYEVKNAKQVDADSHLLKGLVKNKEINSIRVNGVNADLLYDWKQISHPVALKPGLNAISIIGYSDSNYQNAITQDTVYIFNGADLIITAPKKDYLSIPGSSYTLTGMVKNGNISSVRINGEKQTLKWAWRQFDKKLSLDTTKENTVLVEADYQGYEKGVWYQYTIRKTIVFTPEIVTGFDFTTEIGLTSETAPRTKNNVEYIGALIKDKEITKVTVNGKEVPIEYSWRQISVGVPLTKGLNKITFVGYGGTDGTELIESIHRYLYFE